MALTARQDKPSDNRTYTNHKLTMRTKSEDRLTSQASSTLVSASTDTIRESMISGHSHEDRGMVAMRFICIPRANTVLHFASHSSASLSETSTNVVGCGLGSLQDDCENLLLWEMDVINVEPSEHILDTVLSHGGQAEADHAPYVLPLVSWHSVIKNRMSAGIYLRQHMYLYSYFVGDKISAAA